MKNTSIQLVLNPKMTLMELTYLIMDSLNSDQIPLFIALLEESCEDWDITEQLINHFEYVKRTKYYGELEEEERTEVATNLLTGETLAPEIKFTNTDDMF